MRVVFMEEVEGTARVGEVKNVADGFARNYLLPRRLAAPATDHYVTIAQARAEKEARRQAKVDEEVREHVVPRVEGRTVTIEARVGEQGKLFGSVTARDIAQALQELTGVELEHRQIDLRHPLRDLGTHEVTVKLTRNVLVQTAVVVEPLGGLPEEGAEAEEAAGEEHEEAEVVEAPVADEEPAPEDAAEEAVEEPEAEADPESEEAKEEPPAEDTGEEAAEEPEAEAEPAEEEAEVPAAEEEAGEEPPAEDTGEEAAEEPEAEAEPAEEEAEEEKPAAEEEAEEEEPAAEGDQEKQE